MTFPRDVPAEKVLQFITSLSGLRGSTWSHLVGLETVVFEVEADEFGIKHRVLVPSRLADYFAAELRGHLPGVRRTVEESAHHKHWEYAVEIGLTTTKIALRINSIEAMTTTLLSAMSPLRPKQALLMQWVVAPAHPERVEKGDKAHEKKQSEHTFLAVGRLAARGDRPFEAKRLVRRLYVGLSSAKTHGVNFRTRSVPKSVLHRRLNQRSAVLGFPAVLNVSELAALIALPTSGVSVAGLPQGSSRQLPPDPSIPRQGFVIGESNFPGGERPLAISELDRTKHIHLLGQTGTGKSTVIKNLAAQEMAEGYGLALIDPNGDLYDEVADVIPRERIGDAILFDPTDEAMPIGLNVLEGDNPYLTTDRVLSVFDGLYDLGRMPRTYDVTQNAVLLLATRGLTLMDMPLLLSTGERGKDFRHHLTRGLDGPMRHFWQTFDSLKDSEQLNWTAPLLHRLSPLNLRPSLRASLGQVNSAFNMSEVIRDGKILLVNLSKGRIGEDTSSLFASLIFSQIWQAAQARTDDRKPFFTHLDEFHNFVRTPISFEVALAEARKYGLPLTLAHQGTGQLTPSMRDAVMTNAANKVFFRTAASDAASLSRELSPYVKAEDMQNLGNYEAVLRVVGTPPATVMTSPPARSQHSARAARAASRRTYGRPIAEVEAELSKRHQQFGQVAKNKPSIGRVDE